jgi:hypothetical protein
MADGIEMAGPRLYAVILSALVAGHFIVISPYRRATNMGKCKAR